MEDIRISLMNYPTVYLNHEKVNFPYRKAEGLLYYLCLHSRISREQAISIFWSECEAKAARKNLRDAIYSIRKTLGNDVIETVGYNLLGLNWHRIASVDVKDIDVKNAMDTYQGEFLAHFYIKNCQEFDIWAEEYRQYLKNLYMKSLRTNVPRIRKGEESDRLERCTEILFNGKIWDENIFRMIMEKYGEIGQYNHALQVFQRLVKALEEDLNTDPEPETEALIRKIRGLRDQVSVGNGLSGEYFYGRNDLIYDFLPRIQEDSDSPKSYLLTGEAGVGKTMILKRLQKLLDNSEYVTFFWKCFDSEKNLYLRPWYHIIERLQQYCTDKALQQQFSVTSLFEQNVSETKFFLTRFELLAEAEIRAVTDQFPEKKVVLFFDDIQWMDDTSLQLLKNLMYCMGNRRLLLFAACREDFFSDLEEFLVPLSQNNLLESIEIYRFTKEETRNIIRECRPEIAENEEWMSELYEQSQGNALFLMELLGVFQPHAFMEWKTPKTTNHIRSQLLYLEEKEKKLLELLAVYGQAVSLEELILTFDLEYEECMETVEKLYRKKFLVANTTKDNIQYTFSHGQVKCHIYENLSYEKRKWYHYKIASYYEKLYRRHTDLDICARMIFHYGSCGAKYQRCWYHVEYLELFYDMHHDFIPITCIEREYATPEVELWNSEGKLEELVREIRGMPLQEPKEEYLRMKAEYLLGRYEVFQGNYGAGIRALDTGYRLALKQRNVDYIFRICIQMICYCIRIQDLHLMDYYLEKVLWLFQEIPRDLKQYCLFYQLEGLYYIYVGRYQEAGDTLEYVIKELECMVKKDEAVSQQLAVAYNYLGELKLELHRWEDSLKEFRQAIHYSGKNMFRVLGIFYTNAGIALYHLKQYGMAEETISRAIGYFEESGAYWGYAKAKSYAALLALKRKDFRSARIHCREAREKGRNTGNPQAMELVSYTERRISVEESNARK